LVTSDFVGNRVGETYDYVGDVASYAWQQRPRNVNTAAYSGQIDQVNESSDLGTGGIIGIIVGVLCLLVLCGGALCYFMLGNKQRGFNGPQEN